MDVKRIENIAVPTALTAVGGGVAGYIIPKMAKNGTITDEFVKYASETMSTKDSQYVNNADKLDEIKFLPSQEEIAKLDSHKNRSKKILDLYQKTAEKGNKKLENFVMKNAKIFDIQPAKDKTLREAAKEFINGKTIEEIKEIYLPATIREGIESTDYTKLIKETFEEVYDKTTRKFKSDADSEMVNMFKKSAKDMKIAAATKWAAIAGSIALVGSIVLDKIIDITANRVANKIDR